MIAAASLSHFAQGEPNETWNRCKEILKDRLSEVEFTTWVDPVVADSFEDGCFRLVVPNRFHKEYLRKLVDLSGAFESVLGRPVRIGFVEEERPSAVGSPVSAAMPARPVELKRVVVSGPVVAPVRPPVSQRQAIDGHVVVREPEETGLRAQYTFDRFVEGPCNQVARGLAMLVSRQGAAHSFNPLLVHGSAGVGKTHLLQAVGNHALSQGLRARYVTSERFVSSFVRALKNNSAWAFSRSFLDVDVLIVDDVQFLGKTEKIQEQFATIFNSLIHENRQVVLSFDRVPSKIPGLQASLVSRFQGGVMAELGVPGFELRRQILGQRAEELGLRIGSDTIDVVARTRGSVRQLEGIMNRLLAEQSFGFKSPSIGSVIAEVTGEEVGALNLQELVRIVSEKTGVPVDVMRGRSRRRPHVQARHLAMYLARTVTHDTYTSIAEFFDGRDHSSVMHGVQSIEDLRDVDAELNRQVVELLRTLGASE